MTTLFGAIADDFTGATDLAGILARSGVKVSLRIGVPNSLPTDTAPFEIIALKCRTAPVDDAIAECCEALSWLQSAGATRFFWKYCSTFDSTAKGNIGAVAEALMADLKAEQTIYCPAFPENGRSIYMGNLFVGQQLLAESPMKDHPLTPMRDSNLVRLLTPQVSRAVGLADHLVVAKGAVALREKLGKLKDENIAHVIIDAVAGADLETIAEACHDMILMTGGSAIAMPLPHIYKRLGMLATDAPTITPPTLNKQSIILSGSCSAMTNQQVTTYLESGGKTYQINPLELAEQGVQPILDWIAHQDLTHAPLIYATADPKTVAGVQEKLGRDKAGKIVEDALAACALKAWEKGARRFIVAGGETSGAVTKKLGITRLDIGAEITPGVPWTFSICDGEKMALALKSGNFGNKDFFSNALEML